METTTFTALCERAGRWWTIRVPQVEGLTAQVRSLDQAEIITRQFIARALGIPPESIKVEVLPEAPAPVAQALQARHAALQDAAMMLGLSAAEIELFAPAMSAPDLRSDSGPLQMADQ